MGEKTEPGSQPPSQADGPQDVTQQLLDAAAEVFGEKGFDNASVAEIARKRGLSTGAVYSRWLTKRELFIATVDRRATQGAESVARMHESSASETLDAIGSQLLAPSDDFSRNVLLEACVIARRDSSLGEDIARSLDKESAVLSDLVAKGKAAGEIDKAISTDAIVFACQSLGLGVRLAAAAGPRTSGIPTEADWRFLLGRFISSISPPPGADPQPDG